MAGDEEVPRRSSRVKARCQRDGGRATVRAQGVSAARQYCLAAKRPKFSQKSSSHGGQPCSQFKAWALAAKGKATFDVDYNPEDPPAVYKNATVHSRLSEYTSMARAVHGPEYDPSTQLLDGEVVIRVGGGKKHGRYGIGDNTLDTATTPTLSQIRARSTSSSPTIRPRLDTAQHRIEALQAQLEEERRLREEMVVRIEANRQAHQQWMEAHRQRMEAHRQRMEADRQAHQQRMEQLELMFQWIKSIAERMGQPPPPMLFPFPPPPATTPNQSVASNDGPRDSPESSWPAW